MCSLRKPGSHKHFCGATLIRPDVVLAAAHCIDSGKDNGPERPVVYCGLDRLDQNDADRMFNVRSFHVHPRWSSGNVRNGYDLALLKLDRNASVTLEDLPVLDAGETYLKSGENLTALGRGKTLTNETSNELRMAPELQYVPSDICNEKYWDGRIKEERMICAGLGTDRVCQGDSGGPLIRADIPQGNLDLGKASRDVVVGITSFNFGPEKCGEVTLPAIFTRIAYFVDWISEVVGEDITKGRRPGQTPGSHTKHKSGEQPLSSLPPDELLEEMKKALKKDDDVRANLVLEHLHVNTTVAATIPRVGRCDFPLLHAAAMFDAPKCAQAMIDAGAGLDSQTSDYYGMTPLHVSAIFGSLRVAEVLLNQKNAGSVYTRDNVGDMAMHKAATHGHIELMEFLFGKSKSTYWFPINYRGDSPLHQAARAGQVDAVKLLLERGADSDCGNEYGWTPLHHAAFNNHTTVVKSLLNYGANIDTQDTIGETALHKACWNGNDEIVRILLQEGANQYSRENGGYTAIHNAIRNGHIEAVKVLLQSGVSPNTASYKGTTALHFASRHGHMAIARLLIEQGASIEAENKDGNTPLSMAVYNKHVEVVELLTSEGARVNSYRDSDGQTLLHQASINGDKAVVEVLLRNGADLHATDDAGETALHEAAEYGNRDVVEVLLVAGALKCTQNNEGYTPQDWVCDNKGSCEETTKSTLQSMLEP